MVVSAFLTLSLSATAGLPRLEAPFIIQRNGGRFQPDPVADQFFVDWNGDGISEIGTNWSDFREGKLRIYRYYLMFQPLLSMSYVLRDSAARAPEEVCSDNLTAGLISNPFFTDWDGDGRADLLVGQFIEGMIRFYPNTGTGREPVFGDYTYLRADSRDITTTYS